MSLRMGLGPGAACAVLLTLAPLSFAQPKIATINLQKAVFDTADIKKANAEMEARYKPRADSLRQTQEQLSQISQRLERGSGQLTPQAESDLRAQGTRLQKEAQRLQEDLQADVQADRQEILSKASQRMTDVIKKLAEDKGIDLVVEEQSILYYFKPAMDITADATAAYDKAHPVAAAPVGK
ncbi:MAG: OmpH family outer membrane protein [Bryobacteraceae bacterium]